MRRSPIGLAALAMSVMAAAGAAADAQTPPPSPLRNAFGSFGAYSGSIKRGPGWTFAQVKRMAKKRRNVLRNRRAHRGVR